MTKPGGFSPTSRAIWGSPDEDPTRPRWRLLRRAAGCGGTGPRRCDADDAVQREDRAVAERTAGTAATHLFRRRHRQGLEQRATDTRKMSACEFPAQD